MIVILPFEEEFYRRAGIEVRYVGHPLAEAVRTTASREDFCRRHGLDPARPIVALLPGSRHKEIQYHLPVMLDAALRLRIATCELRMASPSAGPHFSYPQSAIGVPQFVVPLASTVRRNDVAALIREAQLASTSNGESEKLSVAVVEGDTYNVLGHAEFAVVASGTATVEAALAGTPMVIIYRGSELNWRLIRPLIHLDTFGMVNLIAGRHIVPELIQHDATGEKIAMEASSILGDPARLARMREDLDRVRELLAAKGGSASERAAKAVIEVIRGS
jgi:lipid-A-disaccharide synthase